MFLVVGSAFFVRGFCCVSVHQKSGNESLRLVCLLARGRNGAHCVSIRVAEGIQERVKMANQNPPNIILINCDDLGYGDLGCYGSTKNQTPHVDRLAAEGMRLTDFYMASPVCSASRAAMMTGCYPARIGFDEQSVLWPGSPYGLHANEITLADQCKSAGYATAMVGKWHCGDQPDFLPTAHGFDQYFGIPFSNDMGRQSNNPENPPLPLLRDTTVIQEQPDQRGITERYTDEALQFIHAHQDQPFFLYLAHMYVHVPLFVPKQFLEESDNGAYGGAVQCIDWSTGVLMDALDRLGLAENTIIIFTSDNGSRNRDEGGSNAPCRGRKGTTWEGGQRVPCIIRWPERIQPGSMSSALTRSIDLFPTLSGILKVDPPSDRVIDGVDIRGLWEEKTPDLPNDTMLYYWKDQLCAIRKGDWKLHFKVGGWDEPPPENLLFNLAEDVGEENDLYDRHPEIVQELEAEAERWRQDLGDTLRDVRGHGRRELGHAENAKPLTEYREDHPYMVAMYDLPDMPTLSG